MEPSKALALHEEILQLRKTKLWEHLAEIGSARQAGLMDQLVKAGLESTDARVRILAQHVVVSRDVWGEISSIDSQAEEILTENQPDESPRSEYEYDSP